MSTVSTKMVVPDTITVGFQKRGDTYTGKLAYIIYTDSKGVLRKEGSWNSWRDKKIESITFKNEPQADFVLNKKVGGYRSDWNHRATYVRVYDSRGFEFEIGIPNLLYILQETSAIKGKGIDGECVYAWHGTNLVLLPTCSAEYQECVKFTKTQSKKVEKADKVPGHTFLMKDMTNVMYLGRLPFARKDGWRSDVTYSPLGLKHVFLRVEKSVDKDDHEEKYIALDGFTKIAERTSDSVSTEFDRALMNFKTSRFNDEAVAIKYKKVGSNFGYSDTCFVKIGDKYHPAKRFEEHSNYRYNLKTEQRFIYNNQPMPEIVKGAPKLPKFPGDRYDDDGGSVGSKTISNEEFYDAVVTTKKGHEVKLTRGYY